MQNLNRKEETNENDQSGNYFNDSYKNNKNRINNIISISILLLCLSISNLLYQSKHKPL